MRTPEEMKEIGIDTRFSSYNQPSQPGRKSGPITQFLREYGDVSELKFTIEKVNKDGEFSVTTTQLSTGSSQTINQAIAARLLQQALNGDIKAIKEILNRTEGRVPQPIRLGDKDGNPLSVVLMVPDSGRMAPLPPTIPIDIEPDEQLPGQ
ncbi:hypothetical protein [Spirosoma spitsbergense]|uniref:hypothetical protein n=1 Tax=Spirosoma spitsbergense TaxID=431554 RepID=UPI000361AF2D|nr:hypothetical protein [Spirosoma spitsbergense]